MVNVDDAFEMRYKFAGEEFQVLVDFDKLNEFKAQQGKSEQSIQISDVLADDKIFKDQKKGEVATAYLNKLRVDKKNQIISYIAEQSFNPQTKTKYTSSMI